MRSLRRIAALFALFSVGLISVSMATAQDAVFQYTATAPTKKGMASAYLWIPPQAQTIRGVVVGGMTLAERELARDAIIRKPSGFAVTHRVTWAAPLLLPYR